MPLVTENPGDFIGRVPYRIAQLLNPHSFLTRHIRLGRYPMLSSWVAETLVCAVVLASFAVILLGTVGAAALARGPYARLTLLVVGYHVLVIAALALVPALFLRGGVDRE